MSESIVTCEDNMVMMSRYPDKFFDLAIVDPPYGIGAEIGTNKQTKKKFHNRKGDSWDKATPSVAYFTELFRCSKMQIIWGGNYFNLPPSRHFAVWDKLIDNLAFADCEYAWVSEATGFGVSGGRVFSYNPTRPSQRLNKIHPTQKPVKLYEWCIDKYAKSGDKILDTHLGSQSSRIAAYNLGFDFYGCELDKEYYDQGCNRFNDHIKQLTLF